MKNNILTVAILAATLIIGCKDEPTKPEKKSENSSAIEIKKQNVGLYAKLTATWCGPCGGWGWTLNDEILDALGDDAILTSFYGSASSKLQNGTAIQFTSDFGEGSFPGFTFNGIVQTVSTVGGGVNTVQTKANVITESEKFKNAPVEIGLGGKLTWEGDKLTLKYAVKPFKDQTGDFYVGVYIAEDGVMEEQANQNGIVAHHHVLRDRITNPVYGNKFEGSLKANIQTDLDEITYDIDSSWEKGKIEVFGVIWKKSIGGGYEFVNAARFK